ncbi:DAHP synthetase [Acaromyces ingoldii]|uniref:Phospho-2-dehydro-3-deoxyheptonate aldolase n=1 Tax=Acaromyces ingoldii TaxID=215250 RepID=A0A316YWQ3_9BASI|nr:DAHP synthetase [Acaromyces ingoldii]PWN93960.1 DAHP synthetase [Acaromyces ingoldii]
MTSRWTPSSWRTKTVAQPVQYPSQEALSDVTKQLVSLPGLVTPYEIQSLRRQLRDVAQGKAFLLQAGDCAELFADCTPAKIEEKVKLQLLMSLIIIWGSRLPVVRVGRIAGQYAKPRSKPTETVVSERDGSTKQVPSFRGDNVNGFSQDDRIPDPRRLLSAYFYSAATLNHIRASLASGLADLHAPLSWTTAHVRSPTLAARFEAIVSNLTDALDFMRVVGAEQSQSVLRNLETVDYFSSHEGLMLEFEEALTRSSSISSSSISSSKSSSNTDNNKNNNKASNHHPVHTGTASTEYYALSAHTLWMGDRTRDPNGAHAEFFSGIANPIGIKVGPSMTSQELLDLLAKVDGSRGLDVGRITLICRFGRGKAPSLLGHLIAAVQASPWATSVIWCCDPMHGNTTSSPSDPRIKTRSFSDIITELKEQLEVHSSCGSRLAGVHLELTGEVDEKGDSVTECTGGAMSLEDGDLKARYRTHCDPRLNLEQSLDVSFLLSHALKAQRMGRSPLAPSPGDDGRLGAAGFGGLLDASGSKDSHEVIFQELLRGPIISGNKVQS